MILFYHADHIPDAHSSRDHAGSDQYPFKGEVQKRQRDKADDQKTKHGPSKGHANRYEKKDKIFVDII